MLLTTRPLRTLFYSFISFAFTLLIITIVYLIVTKSLQTDNFIFNKTDTLIKTPEIVNRSLEKVKKENFSLLNIPEFVDRYLWGAEPFKVNLPGNTNMRHVVFIKETKRSFCTNFSDCSKEVKAMQTIDIRRNKFKDIRYNFLVGGDGRIYEGRGWKYDNEESNLTIEIAFMGDFSKDEATQAMFDVTERRIKYGQSYLYLSFGKLCLKAYNGVSAKLSVQVEQFLGMKDYIDYCEYLEYYED